MCKISIQPVFSSIPWVAHQCLILKFIEIKFTKTLIIDPIAVDKPLPEVYVVETVLYKIYSVIISAMFFTASIFICQTQGWRKYVLC